MTAGRFWLSPGDQRMRAFPSSRATIALLTPGTLWIASVTWRAQLPHVIPLTASSVMADGALQAYDRLPMVTAKARNPIVVFPKPLPDAHHFPVHVRSRFRDSAMDRQNRPPFEIFPSFPGRLKPGSDFAQADNGRANQLL